MTYLNSGLKTTRDETHGELANISYKIISKVSKAVSALLIFKKKGALCQNYQKLKQFDED